ncbi:hypothetical protein BHM03_00051087 [Ensete ventricosum]|nr:hypothetical protein BHM03_00051087 [Ensete ventricosum]
MDLQRKQLNDCRAEITALKMHIEGARASRGWTAGEGENKKAPYTEKSKEEKKSSYNELEEFKSVDSSTRNPEFIKSLSEDVQMEEKVVEINELAVISKSVESLSTNSDGNDGYQASEDVRSKANDVVSDSTIVSCNGTVEYQENVHNLISESQSDEKVLDQNSVTLKKVLHRYCCVVFDSSNITGIGFLANALSEIIYQRCPPLSGVEGSVDSHLRVLGEQERWNIDVLLRMLTGLLPFVHHKAIETCPYNVAEPLAVSEQQNSFFSTSLLQLYAGLATDMI